MTGRAPTLLLLLAVLLPAGCGAMDEAGNTIMEGTLTVSLLSSATPAPGDIARVKAVVSDTLYLPASYTWEVRDPGKEKLTVRVEDKVGQVISFRVATEGTHRVACRVKLFGSEGVLTREVALQVADPAAKRLTYTARALPPASAGLPPSEQTVKVGSVDQAGLSWALATGEEVTLSLEDKAGKPVPANVRLFTVGDDPLPRDLYLPSGSVKARLADVFHALVLPLPPSKGAAALAPLLKPYVKASGLSTQWTVTVDPGVLISGSVRGAQGSALAGARVSISSRDPVGLEVPSTVATADQAGGFSVRARAGKATLTVVPPAGSGLAPALVQAASLQVLAASSGWSFTFAKPDMVQVQATALTSDGSTPAAGAAATFTLIKGAYSTGKLSLSTGASFSAEPLLRRTLVADAKGELRHSASTAALSLPRGKYSVALWPGAASPAGDGYRVATVDLTSSGSAPAKVQLKLAPRARLSGLVAASDGKPVRARVTVRGNSGAYQALAGEDGKFSLDLDDGLEYRLVARALGGEAVSGSLIRPVIKVSGPRDLGKLILPRAVLISGTVTSSGGFAMPGVLVRAWCSDAACSDRSIVDETTSLAEGKFELRLPPTGQ